MIDVSARGQSSKVNSTVSFTHMRQTGAVPEDTDTTASNTVGPGVGTVAAAVRPVRRGSKRIEVCGGHASETPKRVRVVSAPWSLIR